MFGIIIGPLGAKVFNPRAWTTNLDSLTLEIMRITLATGVFAIGVDLPPAYLAKKWKDLAIFVVPTMAFGWVVSAAFIYGLFPGLSIISALCISACLTPTDPVRSLSMLSSRLIMVYKRYCLLPLLLGHLPYAMFQIKFVDVSQCGVELGNTN